MLHTAQPWGSLEHLDMPGEKERDLSYGVSDEQNSVCVCVCVRAGST